MPSPRFEHLLAQYLDGDLADADREELAAEVEGDPAAARTLDEALAFEALLIAAHAGAPDAAAGRTRVLHRAAELRQAPSVLWPRWATAAAAVVVGIIGALVIAFGLRTSGPHEVLSGRVLVDGAEARRLKDGARLEVAGESDAVVRLADGSRVVFAPASVATLRGSAADVRQHVELAAGKGAFHVGPGPRRFTVSTPVGTVTVLGTDFSVELRGPADPQAAAGATMMLVAVEGGKVGVDYRGNRYELAAGESRLFGDLPAQPPRTTVAQETAASDLPAALRGFRGVLRGTVVRKLGDGFWLKVDRIEKVWQQSRASDPAAAVGQELRIIIGLDAGLADRHQRTLEQLPAGSAVVVEAFDLGDRGLTAVEELHRAE